MRQVSRTCVAVVVSISMSTGGAWALASTVHAGTGPEFGALDKSPVVKSGLSASIQNEKDRLREERIKLANAIAAVERVRTENTILGRRIRDRLKRVVAILEIPDLSAADRAKRFDELGISRFYRGEDLVVKTSASEKVVKALGRPVHLAQFLEKDTVPDGGSTRARHEWEADWENAQVDAEDTIVAIEGLTSEAEGWVSDLEAWGNPFLDVSGRARASDANQKLISAIALEGNHESPDGGTETCAASVSPDADSSSDCIEAVGAALAEALWAVSNYLGNTAAVRDALTNARNAVGVALGAFTAGTLTVSGLASAAGAAITALVGSTAAGWIAAGAIAVATGVIVYAVWNNCPPPYEPEFLDLAKSYN